MEGARLCHDMYEFTAIPRFSQGEVECAPEYLSPSHGIASVEIFIPTNPRHSSTLPTLLYFTILNVNIQVLNV